MESPCVGCAHESCRWTLPPCKTCGGNPPCNWEAESEEPCEPALNEVAALKAEVAKLEGALDHYDCGTNGDECYASSSGACATWCPRRIAHKALTEYRKGME